MSEKNQRLVRVQLMSLNNHIEEMEVRVTVRHAGSGRFEGDWVEIEKAAMNKLRERYPFGAGPNFEPAEDFGPINYLVAWDDPVNGLRVRNVDHIDAAHQTEAD